MKFTNYFAPCGGRPDWSGHLMRTSARHCAGGVQSKHILGPRPARLQEQASRIQCPEISLNWCQTTSQCTHLHIDQKNLVKLQQKNQKC